MNIKENPLKTQIKFKSMEQHIYQCSSCKKSVQISKGTQKALIEEEQKK